MRAKAQFFYRVDMLFLVSLLVVSFSGIVVWGWIAPKAAEQVAVFRPEPPRAGGPGPDRRPAPPTPREQPRFNEPPAFAPNEAYAQDGRIDDVVRNNAEQHELQTGAFQNGGERPVDIQPVDRQNAPQDQAPLENENAQASDAQAKSPNGLKSLDEIGAEYVASDAFAQSKKRDAQAMERHARGPMPPIQRPNPNDNLENNPNVTKVEDLKPKFFWGLIQSEKLLGMTKAIWLNVHCWGSLLMLGCLAVHVFNHKEWLATQTIKALQEEDAQDDEDEEDDEEEAEEEENEAEVVQS